LEQKLPVGNAWSKFEEMIGVRTDIQR
jgi:hypothetical protein